MYFGMPVSNYTPAVTRASEIGKPDWSRIAPITAAMPVC